LSPFASYCAEVEQAVQALPEEAQAIGRALECLLQALVAGRKLMFCGNGGSAAAAQHLAAEFMGRFRIDRNPIPAIALTTDTSLLTALANDYGFEDVFARQVQGLGVAGDVLIVFSTSGNSANQRCLDESQGNRASDRWIHRAPRRDHSWAMRHCNSRSIGYAECDPGIAPHRQPLSLRRNRARDFGLTTAPAGF